MAYPQADSYGAAIDEPGQTAWSATARDALGRIGWTDGTSGPRLA